MAVLVTSLTPAWPLILGQSPVGGGRNRVAHWPPGQGFTERSRDSCSWQVSCRFGYVLAEETKHFFFLLFSSLAFENIWACWRKRKITSFVQSECSPPSRGAAKKAYNLPVLQLNCLSVQQGIISCH